jgi:murein DD-endopeptidase MepM/ murein hydrolase activator NlpD
MLKFIWGKKELTLLIIPGANRRTFRIKLPHSSLYIVPSVICFILIGFFLTIYGLNFHFKRTTSSLKESYDGQERSLSNQIIQKNSELEQLQGNLIDLNQQSNEFKAKLEEMKKLKSVIEQITPTGKTGKIENTTSTEKSSRSLPPAHIGGTDNAVTSDDVASLVTGTKEGLTSLVTDITALIGDLTESEAKLQEALHLQNITPTLWPVASRTITSGFGIRIDPFTGKPSMHTGLDINGELNDKVYATAEGKVLFAEFDDQHGNHILIDHTHGLKTEYLHLNRMLVKRGDPVLKGQLIGLMGTTGRSTGTHLHYEVHKNDVQIDPTPYLITNRKEDR